MSESPLSHEFYQVVDALMPYIKGSATAFGESTNQVLEFRKLLSQFQSSYRDIGNRGPAFEELRKLAATDSRNMYNDPRDGIGVKLALRVFARKKDSDEAVIDFLEPILNSLDEASNYAIIGTSLSDGDNYLESEKHVLEVLNLIVTQALGGLPMTDIDEEQFSQRVSAFRELASQRVMDPNMVGNVMISQGLGSFKDAERASKRNAKGKYLDSDLRILSEFLTDTFQPRVSVVSRFQKKMGWVVTDWVPESAVDRLRNAARYSP